MDSKDATILRIIDGLWETYEWVPFSEIQDRLPHRVPLKKKIKVLEKLHLVTSVLKEEPFIKITETGLDSIAVWDFAKHGVIDDIGHVIGEGKEAVVVLALKGDTQVAVKFHRYYSAEFRKIKESLSYSAIKWWRKKIKRELKHVDIARIKAQVEYYTLQKLWGKVSVPKPLGINRHAVAMEFLGDTVPAPLLSKVKKEAWMKKDLLDNYEKAISEGVVHGDMSIFNTIVWNKKLYLIDWPQSVPTDFEGAKQLMERDREKIESGFPQ